ELLLDARADRGDDRADLLVREDLVDAGALDVEDLSSQRQDRLISAVAPLLGGTAGGVTLDQVELAHRRIVDRTVGELARQDAALERALLTRQVTRPARRFARTRGLERLLDDRPCRLGVLVEEHGEVLVDGRLYRPAHLGVA